MLNLDPGFSGTKIQKFKKKMTSGETIKFKLTILILYCKIETYSIKNHFIYISFAEVFSGTTTHQISALME